MQKSRVPSADTRRTSSRISLISPPYAPAFINTAPPIEPGIPEANSNPVRLSSSAALATADINAPLPQTTCSPSILMLLNAFPILTITPS